MKIITWNMNYWQNTHIYDPKKDKFKLPSFKNNEDEVVTWINNYKKYIQELNADIILLQEINPFSLYGKKYERNNQNRYKLYQDYRMIFYHELYNELSEEDLKDNFWGNAIINKGGFTPIKKCLFSEEDNYYGRNGLMHYDFYSPNGTWITIINYYNKYNNKEKCYTMPYAIKTDLENIVKGKDGNIIIFAGDFNSDKERDSANRKFFEFIEEIGFEKFTTGEEFDNTMVPKVRPYPNDKVFVKNKSNVEKIFCKKITDVDINLSDHYPILIEITEKKEIKNDGKSHPNRIPSWDELDWDLTPSFLPNETDKAVDFLLHAIDEER